MVIVPGTWNKRDHSESSGHGTGPRSHALRDCVVAPAAAAPAAAGRAAALGCRRFQWTITVGQILPDMPLFLDSESYVLVPLEPTYQQAYRGVPRRWREVLANA
jgi:hypothetical protein